VDPHVSFDEVPMRARDELLMFLASQIRLRKPSSVLEIGVAHGVSSAVILHALEENGAGRLTSIDFPMLVMDDGDVGRLVPANLRSRWDLHLGPSSLLLAGLARERAPIDLFLHDGDHTYPAQIADFRSVWPHITSGGLFVVDDVCNPAFEEFADEVGCKPVIVAKSPRGYFGYLERLGR
jgi:predicted O-methyltransferase YrrM